MDFAYNNDGNNMFAKIISFFSEILPYKLSPEEKEFVKLNRNNWKSYPQNCSGINILVEGLLTCPASIIDKARMAKAIEEVTDGKTLVYIRGFYFSSSNVAHIYKSFGIEKFYFWWRSYLNPRTMILSFIQTIKTFMFYNTGEKIIPLSYKNIVIGDLIYDSLIRFKPNTYTINKIKLREHFRLIFRSFHTFLNNERIIKKFKPKYLITSHNVYAEFGLLPRQIRAMNKGIVFLKDLHAYKCYSLKNKINEHFLKMNFQDFESNSKSINIEKLASEYYEKRLAGEISQIDVINAYKNKKKYTINDLEMLFPHIESTVKNIFVMSHAFSDSPHVGEGLLFKDYYDFLEKTLNVLEHTEGINCFVKAHPSSYMWNEKGGVEMLIEKNKLKKVCILPEDFNTKSIINLADAIVTAKGTAGLEFSCAGIPAITAGKGYYYGFGIAYEPETIEAYFDMLKSLADVKKLEEEKRKKAIILLYLISTNKYHSDILPEKYILPDDNYQKIFRSKYVEVNQKIKNGIPMRDAFYDKVKLDVKNANV